MISATALGTYADLQRASWLVRRCGLAASVVRGAVHGGHSWFHHYSVLYRNSIFRVQYFSTCDISEFVFRYPLGCVPVSSLLHTINRCRCVISYSHIGSFKGMRLYHAIFVIYMYTIVFCTTGTQSIPVRHCTWRETLCTTMTHLFLGPLWIEELYLTNYLLLYMSLLFSSLFSNSRYRCGP